MKMFVKANAAAIVLSVGAFIAAPAMASVTIDFSGHASGSPIGNTYSAQGVTFSNATFAQCGGGCPAPTPFGYFAFWAGGSTFTANFASSQSLVTFQTVSFSSTLAQAYNASNMLVASIGEDQSFPVTNAVLSLAGLGITKVVFTSNGGANGPAITNFTFGSAPEPATWALMVSGIGLLGFALRNRTRAIARFA